ncbi:MAG: response regulator [Magnetovibrio sp.]|nr:response regulator [Magnetovibrio sp.]
MGQEQLRIGWQTSAVELSFGEREANEQANDTMGELRFCIIGEQAHARKTIRHIFQSVGIWSVSESKSCGEAMKLLSENRHDAIILDVGSDRKAWLSFIRTLRAHQREDLSQMPVILITAVADTGEIELIRDMGVNAILLKPYSSKGLMTRVRKALDRSASFVRQTNYIGPCRRVRPRAADTAGPERRAA